MTINELLKHPFAVSFIFFAATIISGVVSALIRWYLTKNSTEFRVFRKALDKKADTIDLKELETLIKEKPDHKDLIDIKDSFTSFKERFGKELERQTTSNIRIEKCMIYLVKEQGGDPVAMGLIK